jgi:hypothetical protein
MPRSKLLEEFEAARDDLGIEIVAPYEVELPEGTKIRADVLLRNFGGRNGTLIFTSTNGVAPYGDQLCNLHYGVSVLEEPGTANYDRDVFVDMLSEWEWTGSEAAKPNWIKRPLEEK